MTEIDVPHCWDCGHPLNWYASLCQWLCPDCDEEFIGGNESTPEEGFAMSDSEMLTHDALEAKAEAGFTECAICGQLDVLPSSWVAICPDCEFKLNLG